MIIRSSTASLGMVPSATLSTTALATAVCAGPYTMLACRMPVIVTVGTISVSGFTDRLGSKMASSGSCPAVGVALALANASASGPFLLQASMVYGPAQTAV